jgi:hypothetical protein
VTNIRLKVAFKALLHSWSAACFRFQLYVKITPRYLYFSTTHDLPDIIYHSKTDPVQLDTTQLNCLLYADDLVLLSESEKGLQSCLAQLNSYCSRWKFLQKRLWIFSKGRLSHFSSFVVKSLIQISDAYVTIGLMRVSNNLKRSTILSCTT